MTLDDATTPYLLLMPWYPDGPPPRLNVRVTLEPLSACSDCSLEITGINSGNTAPQFGRKCDTSAGCQRTRQFYLSENSEPSKTYISSFWWWGWTVSVGGGGGVGSGFWGVGWGVENKTNNYQLWPKCISLVLFTIVLRNKNKASQIKANIRLTYKKYLT